VDVKTCPASLVTTLGKLRLRSCTWSLTQFLLAKSDAKPVAHATFKIICMTILTNLVVALPTPEPERVDH